ncbi:MAG: DUF1003 domain-containing protein [Candidatus Woesearchaeota archaeon]|nr:DUF1003 domain-containing protein [Candidatus Woesearchaeota archaeon]MDP7323370.1 DUF1003 domain-containing protein [Candidatus Woesearchaeota archaeon]MDP7458099.1 DUF1003 domain-containing protein [Candidatus Woesearchaeota archaeon]
MGRKKKRLKTKVVESIKCIIHKHEGVHPALGKNLTLGQRSADTLTNIAGSWYFIIGLSFILVAWIILNISALVYRWDPYPFILLNFVLSMLAAFQAPIILKSQTREMERDRQNARYDYIVNRKAEREIQDMQKDLEQIKVLIKESHKHILKIKPKKRKKSSKK